MKMKERFYIWLAWKLPEELVSWAFCRVVGYATTGEYSNTEVSSVKAADALFRWMGKQEDHA